jgi:sigma-B regulation protein RsbU (phosphoserine phosphatase)
MPSPDSSVADESSARSPDIHLDAFHAALLQDDAEALYERAPCGYVSTTPDGTLVKVNQTFLSWTGYQRDDLIGRKTFAELLSAGGRIYHETHYAPMLRLRDRVQEIALDIVRSDGRRLPVLVNSVLERDPAGEPVVIRTAIFDATERRLYERELVRAKQRAEESEARATVLARTLQRTFIPPEPPEVDGLEVAAVYRPAGTGDEVGGDFYDVFERGPGDWVVAVGDVCGKGVAAAIVTAAARFAIRGAAVQHREPARMLEALNQALLRQGADRFCTVVLMRLHQVDGQWTATIGLGGHPLPVLARHGSPVRVGRPGSLLGVLAEPQFYDVDVILEPGDVLMAYTDGVTEGRRGDDFYGEARLDVAVTSHTGSARAMTDGILADVLQFQSGMARDDIVILAVGLPTD